MIVGIDLGTTNSLIAVWEAGRPQLIPNSLGEFLTPSCVSMDEDGSILVGRAARERLQTHPDKTAAVFKRFMGSERAIRLGHPITKAIVTVPAYYTKPVQSQTFPPCRRRYPRRRSAPWASGSNPISSSPCPRTGRVTTRPNTRSCWHRTGR